MKRKISRRKLLNSTKPNAKNVNFTQTPNEKAKLSLKNQNKKQNKKNKRVLLPGIKKKISKNLKIPA
jgi:hypothetical protein